MAMAVTCGNFGGRIVSENRGGVEKDYVRDTLGSTAMLLDSSGSITDEWTYWPYGEVRSRTGTTPTAFTFGGTLGYFADGLMRLYIRARYYLPETARWLTVDPLWPAESPFSYAEDAPSAFTDPAGTSIHTPKDWSNCKKGQRCLGVLVKWSGKNNPFAAWHTSCFKTHSNWDKSILTCACNNNVNPVLLMAMMFIESHFGTMPTKNPPLARCCNPISCHFREKDSLFSLLLDNNGKCQGTNCCGGEFDAHNCYPTFERSVCCGASTVKKDGGLDTNHWGGDQGVADKIWLYDQFVKICKDKGLYD